MKYNWGWIMDSGQPQNVTLLWQCSINMYSLLKKSGLCFFHLTVYLVSHLLSVPSALPHSLPLQQSSLWRGRSTGELTIYSLTYCHLHCVQCFRILSSFKITLPSCVYCISSVSLVSVPESGIAGTNSSFVSVCFKNFWFVSENISFSHFLLIVLSEAKTN